MADGVDTTGQILLEVGLRQGWLAFGAVFALLLFLVLTGRLVPRSALRDEREDTARLQSAVDKKDATIDSLQRTVSELTTVGRASMRVITAVQQAAAATEETDS